MEREKKTKRGKEVDGYSEVERVRERKGERELEADRSRER